MTTRPDECVDPFGTTADPGSYVPLAAAEKALESLESVLLGGASFVLLVGESGCGKTLILHLLQQRLRPERDALYLPYPALPTPALCAWAQTLMGWERSYDPIGSIVAHAKRLRDEGGGLVLIVDDLGDMPAATLLELVGACEEAEGSLQLVGAAEPSGACEAADLIAEVETVTLFDPLGSKEETRSYVEAHLGRAGVPDAVRARFDQAGCERLHERSRGVPALLNTYASQLLRRGSLEPAPGASTSALDRWEGASSPALEPWEPAEVELSLEGPREALEEGDELALELETDDVVGDGVPLEDEDLRLGTDDVATGELPIRDEAVDLWDEAEFPEPEPIEPPPAPIARPAQTDGDRQTDGETALERATALLAAAHSSELEPSLASKATEPAVSPVEPPAPERRLLLRGALAACIIGGALLAGLAVGYFGLRGPADPPAGQTPPVAAAPLAEPTTGWVGPGVRIEERPLSAPVREAEPAAQQAPGSAAEIRVQINATPWAKIRVDGRDVGVTPLAGVPLAVGSHRFEAHFPDGRVLERIVEIGEQKRHVAFP